MITTKEFGRMPCLRCKEYFNVMTCIFSRKISDSFYYCEKCLKIIQPERSKREDSPCCEMRCSEL